MSTKHSTSRPRFTPASTLGSVAILLATLLGCAKPPPPPAAAAAPIDIDGTHDRLDAVETHKYLHYSIGTHIDAPPEAVWAVLTDASAYTEWNSTVVSLEGDIALDRTISLVSRANPKRTFELTVSTFDPPGSMVWEDGNNAFRGVRTFTLTEADGGTDVTMKEAFSGSMMKMIAPKLPDFGDDFDDFAADLKRHVEGSPG